ncbi:POP1-domain-containing protein [Cylindrobasidium torrendii FP15055 ss-10]|uniref:POP1-domain-containing protein n=1 Tax=Cylindrobasidium torrendii FP15055 ss-10 TaxID=1314674 RepID=A0A0D7BMX7_9AGAR|nr:POP1-domain-containing protein [Cylindrobasidium torrendii FP15055 ss-10]
MAPKRPVDPDALSGRDRKKQKLNAARTIAVQQEPTAGPSTANSMARLPGVLNAEKFVEARQYEVKAMANAIKSAHNGATHRVWQTLPRHLRRRAASHDVRRVPARLRAKAVAEMDAKPPPPKHKPKRGKNKQISKTEEYLKRQRDKTWLETHKWHAKRMKMETKWGYRIAMHTSDKSFRSSHRAAVHGAIIHDASYESVIEMSGQLKVLTAILDMCMDLQEVKPGAPRYTAGSRAYRGHLYKPGTYPYDLVALVTILWRPPVDTKGKQPAHKDEDAVRQLWIRAHPATFDAVFDALQTSATKVLQMFKSGSAVEGPVDVELVDMRGQLNIYDIMGPKSSQVLKGALQPAAIGQSQEFKQFWSALKDLQSPGGAVPDMVIGFTVNDPRLKFPPKNSKPADSDQASPMLPFPASLLAQSPLWDETKRMPPKFKKKDLDERREKNLIPGTKLQTLRQDDRVPVLLIQRSLRPSASSAERSDGLHGWTLIIPSGWSMPFWDSLTYTGTRVGGQRECQVQSFEAGVPFFPKDFPTTELYDSEMKLQAQEEEETWNRKPPAKRPNYTKLLTRSPWRPDWDAVLGKTKPDAGLLTTQRGEGEDDDMDGVQSYGSDLPPWLVSGPKTHEMLAKLIGTGDAAPSILFSEVNALRAARGIAPLTNVASEGLMQSALLPVRLDMAKRGSPQDNAMIHVMPDEEIMKWEKEKAKSVAEKSWDEADTEGEGTAKIVIPDPSTVIGFVTTGHFSLARGEFQALGCIPLSRYLELQQQRKRICSRVHNNGDSSIWVQLRNADEGHCRVAKMDLV